MRNINVKVPNDIYKIIADCKLDNNLKKLEEALIMILKEYKQMKGGVVENE